MAGARRSKPGRITKVRSGKCDGSVHSESTHITAVSDDESIDVAERRTSIDKVDDEETTLPESPTRRRKKKNGARRVRFDSSQSQVITVSYQHDCMSDDEKVEGEDMVAKTDLWWSSAEKKELMARCLDMLSDDPDAHTFLECSRLLETHALSAQKVINAECIGVLSMSKYRGLETQSAKDNKHRSRARCQDMRSFIIKQNVFKMTCKGSEKDERLRKFREKQTVKFRALARHWGHIDSIAAKL